MHAETAIFRVVAHVQRQSATKSFHLLHKPDMHRDLPLRSILANSDGVLN